MEYETALASNYVRLTRTVDPKLEGLLVRVIGAVPLTHEGRVPAGRRGEFVEVETPHGVNCVQVSRLVPVEGARR